MAGVWAIAVGTVVVHLATGWRYGFDRDELMALEDARHLAWGYVQYPPMTALFGWMALKLFGTSLAGFRFFAAVAQAVALVLTGMMAKEICKAVASKDKKTQHPGSKNKPGAPGATRMRHPQDSTSGEWAAVVAAGAGVPFCLGAGALMQYISFDYLCWVVVAFGMVKVLTPVATEDKKTQDPGAKRGPGTGRGGPQKAVPARALVSRSGEKWWVVVGLGIGLGVLAKYTMAFLAVGVAMGVLSTEARGFLRSAWLWIGVLLSLVLALPNFLWQWQRGFPSVQFLRFLHTRDMSLGLTDWFLPGQVELTLLAFPLALAGLWFYFADEDGAPWRAVGWMYIAPLALLLIMRGRDYYLAPAYPMLYAAGAVWMERRWSAFAKATAGQRVARGAWRENGRGEIGNSGPGEKGGTVEKWNSRTGKAARWMRRWLPAILVADAVVAGCVALPIMPVNSGWWRLAAKVDTVLPEEIGWPELVETVANIRDGLPQKDRARLGILAANYGEVGALNLFGEKYGLPRAISGVNSSWERGYGNPPPETVIVLGFKKEFLEQNFSSCELAGHAWNRYGVANEETIEDPDIFVCRGLKERWEEFWPKVKLFAKGGSRSETALFVLAAPCRINNEAGLCGLGGCGTGRPAVELGKADRQRICNICKGLSLILSLLDDV
jgi:4-amino-4-deoxy-L-arabinose transferase-like glycosyltransferase